MDKKPSGQNRKAMVHLPCCRSVSACGRHTGKGLKTGAVLSHAPLSVSKNWLVYGKLPKCGVSRRIGKPLDRVSHA